jgi:hypothetical protein
MCLKHSLELGFFVTQPQSVYNNTRDDGPQRGHGSHIRDKAMML